MPTAGHVFRHSSCISLNLLTQFASPILNIQELLSAFATPEAVKEAINNILRRHQITNLDNITSICSFWAEILLDPVLKVLLWRYEQRHPKAPSLLLEIARLEPAERANQHVPGGHSVPNCPASSTSNPQTPRASTPNPQTPPAGRGTTRRTCTVIDVDCNWTMTFSQEVLEK
ncbi:hypothetical protein PMG11_06258 [Penicillium brasilianum]|uniref:Uncharacterized protein n=1 Tax=Penicillium brasilianum TaxID=104259 RepID=A0A0F7TLS4_PENBI|nr:hypothetical protein PMG11_06258 [Penicillium brasilianum]